MATIFSKILKGVLVGGGSVLSLFAPAAGKAIVTLGAKINAGGGVDKVANAAADLVTGQTEKDRNAILEAQNEQAAQLAKIDAYNKLIASGVSSADAAAQLGMSTPGIGIPMWLLILGIGLLLLLILPKLFKR